MYRTFSPPKIWREMDRLQRDMNRLFNNYSVTAKGSTFKRFPAVNILHNDDSAKVISELPGLRADEINISVDKNVLNVSGERKMGELPNEVKYHRMERSFGKFSRSIQMPFNIDANNVDAKLVNGVLTVTLPKTEDEKPKKIMINH